MPQSNVIFFYLFAAFFVFITMRGELPKYMGFLLASPQAGSGVTRGPDLPNLSTSSMPANNTSPDWGKIAKIAQFFA
jgi:hypothetical protein